MPRAPTTHKWDEQSHYALLQAFADLKKPNKELVIQLTEHMQSQGFATTESGVRQHIQKLRRTQDSPEKSTAKNGNGNGAASTPTKSKATPTKRKARAPKSGTPAKSAAMVENSDEDDQVPVKTEGYYKDGPDSKRFKTEAE